MRMRRYCQTSSAASITLKKYLITKMDLITETSLQALIQRATDSRNKGIDNAAVEACCGLIKKMPESAYFASKQIASQIQSEDEWAAFQGLSLLGSCMEKCGPCFQSEVAKFRFLNELIKLVSPKFLGARTSPKVRDKVLGLLHSWVIEYPHEHKIKEAFEMLKKQGVFTQNVVKSTSQVCTASKSTPTKTSNVIVDQEFERKLQKLLSSKNSQDLEAANRMIKHKVFETERKVNDLERVRTNVKLLAEMLDCCETGDVSPEDLQLMSEIRSECVRLQPVLLHLVMDAQDEMLRDVLSVGEELNHVVKRYDNVASNQQQPLLSTDAKSSNKVQPSLLDLSPVNGKPVPDLELLKPTTTDLLDEPLSMLELNHQVSSINDLSTEAPKPAMIDLDQLNRYFEGLPSSSTKNSSTTINHPSIPIEKNSKQKALDELDVLGESMLQKCKMDVEPLKVHSPDEEGIVNLEVCTPVDDDLLCVGQHTPNALRPSVHGDSTDYTEPIHDESHPTQMSPMPVKSLADISVSLETIKPSGVPPVKIVDSSCGVSVVLHITKDTPRSDVSVYVVTTTSVSSLPLEDYHFQVKVPKGCKFKLQPPSATNLPPHNPFLPPSAITQVLLIASPSGLKLDLTCMISFTMDDETVTEVGDVTGLTR